MMGAISWYVSTRYDIQSPKKAPLDPLASVLRIRTKGAAHMSSSEIGKGVRLYKANVSK